MHCDTELTHTVSKGVFNISEAAKGSYCSSHDERGYHTANLLKRDALPTDNSADSGFLDRPCSHPSAVTSYNRENRSPQKGDLAVKNRLRTGAATAPLLRRYRLCEPLQKEGTPKNHGSGALGTGQGTWASPHDALPNVSTIFSPIQIPRLIEGRNLEKSCNSAHRPTRTRKGMNPRLAKQTVVPSGHVLNTHEPRGCDLNVEGNCGSGIAPSCPTCSDANCIHGREGILDYVKMQYELRACRGALHEKDVELERLQQRLASAEAEMLSTVSRFERKIMEMEEHHKQTLLVENSYHSERYDTMLSDQMASQERYRKEVQKLQVELDQERSEHVRTRCELEATRDLSNLLKEQVERLRVSLAHSGVRQTSGSPCTEAHGYPPFCDAQSNFATTEPPPQQSNLSNLPQVLLDGESEAKDVDDVASKDSFQVGNPLLSNTYPLPTGDNITTQRNFENSFVELVSPSPECSSRLELGVFGDLLPSAEIKTRVTRAGGTARDDLGDCNKGDNCDVRGCFYFQQLAPGYSTRADKGLGTNSEFMQAIGKPLWSQRQEDIEELHHNAVNKDPPSIHPFDRLLGRDASLCKELLRALLDKEKELFELRSAFGLSGKGVK